MTNNMKEDLEDMKHNPWLVTNLDEFLYYNCPECDNKTQSKAVFINHAYLNHPRVSEISINFGVGSNENSKTQ